MFGIELINQSPFTIPPRGLRFIDSQFMSEGEKKMTEFKDGGKV